MSGLVPVQGEGSQSPQETQPRLAPSPGQGEGWDEGRKVPVVRSSQPHLRTPSPALPLEGGGGQSGASDLSRDSDADAPSHTSLHIAPAQPSAELAHLRSLLAERLGRLPLAAPALELSLHCDATQAGGAPNAELFISQASQREGLARLVERLQARLGAEQVLRLSAVADHRPECASRWQPAEAAEVAGAVGAAGALRTVSNLTGPAEADLARTLPIQPLWLLPRPQALPERGQGPLIDGRPLQLLAGPERLETGWWDSDTPAARDYFIARAASGALVWVYRHRLPGELPAAHPDDSGGSAEAGSGWFLQGLFA